VSRTALDDAMAVLSAVLEDSEHPSPDELLAYQADQLAADARTQLQEHLAWCSECAQTIVDLASWPDVELRDPSLERTAAEETGDWQAIQRRIARGHVSGGAPAPATVRLMVPRQAAPKPPVSSFSFGPIHLLAAVLLLAVIGLSFLVAKLSRWAPLTKAAIVDAPRANVFVVDLEPASTASGTRTAEAGRPDTPETAVPGGVGTVVFLLVQNDLRRFEDHAVELRGADGKVFWQTGGLVSLPEGGFSIGVPLAAVPSNEIEILLYGVNGKGRELLSTYRTRIRRAAAN